MKRFFTFLKTELKLSLRDKNMPIFAVIMPLAIFVILGVIYGAKPAYDGAGYTFLEQSFGAVGAVAICAGGLMGLPQAVSGLRELKILKRFRVTPVSPVFILGVELSLYIVYCIVSLATTLAAAALLRGRAAARLAAGVPWQLGADHALDPVCRHAGERRGEGRQAGQRHRVDPLLPHAALFRRDAAPGGHAAGNAEDRRHFPADAGSYHDEACVFRCQHGKYPAAGLRHGGSHRALHRSGRPVLPLGIARELLNIAFYKSGGAQHLRLSLSKKTIPVIPREQSRALPVADIASRFQGSAPFSGHEGAHWTDGTTRANAAAKFWAPQQDNAAKKEGIFRCPLF